MFATDAKNTRVGSIAAYPTRNATSRPHRLAPAPGYGNRHPFHSKIRKLVKTNVKLNIAPKWKCDWTVAEVMSGRLESRNDLARDAKKADDRAAAESTAAARRAALNVAPAPVCAVLSSGGAVVLVVLVFVSGFKAAFAAAMACRLCANAEACANALDAGEAADPAALGSA